MSAPAISVSIEQQTRALLDLVESDRASRIDGLLGEARSRADALRQQAGAEARTRLRQAFAEQRALRHEHIAAALARRDTQRRLQAQQRTSALLQLAWQRLPGELTGLWQTPSARAAWVALMVAAAREHMSPPGRPKGEYRTAQPEGTPASAGVWSIAHPTDWPADEQRALARALQASGTAPPNFVPDARIRAGLRIAAGGNVIDGTLDGLLAERAEFEARLLRRLETTA